jgi:hypothetical protein
VNAAASNGRRALTEAIYGYLFIDTSPMWMENFIATVKRRHALIADAETGREYDLNDPDDEAAFRSVGKLR